MKLFHYFLMSFLLVAPLLASENDKPEATDLVELSSNFRKSVIAMAQAIKDDMKESSEIEAAQQKELASKLDGILASKVDMSKKLSIIAQNKATQEEELKSLEKKTEDVMQDLKDGFKSMSDNLDKARIERQELLKGLGSLSFSSKNTLKTSEKSLEIAEEVLKNSEEVKEDVFGVSDRDSQCTCTVS